MHVATFGETAGYSDAHTCRWQLHYRGSASADACFVHDRIGRLGCVSRKNCSHSSEPPSSSLRKSAPRLAKNLSVRRTRVGSELCAIRSHRARGGRSAPGPRDSYQASVFVRFAAGNLERPMTGTGRDLASDGDCATGRLCCVDRPLGHSLGSLAASRHRCYHRGRLGRNRRPESTGIGGWIGPEMPAGLPPDYASSSAHPEQVRGFRQLSVDEASVRGVRSVAAQANSPRARSAPRVARAARRKSSASCRQFGGSRGHCEYSSVVDDTPLTVRLIVCRHVADAHVRSGLVR